MCRDASQNLARCDPLQREPLQHDWSLLYHTGEEQVNCVVSLHSFGLLALKYWWQNKSPTENTDRKHIAKNMYICKTLSIVHVQGRVGLGPEHYLLDTAVLRSLWSQ